MSEPTERTYDWNGQTHPVRQQELSDETVGSMVRMLMRDDLDHEEVCMLGRDRIMALVKEKQQLDDEIERLTAENEKWRRLHGADDPEDAIRQDSRGNDARLLDERLSQIRELTAENQRLRKINAHVPPRIYIKAKEDAGFGTAIVTDWTVKDESVVDPTESKFVRLLNGIKTLRRYALVQGYPTTHDDIELIGFAYDSSEWGFAANPKYEAYEALEECEKWLHGKLDELLSGNVIQDPEKEALATENKRLTEELASSAKLAAGWEEEHDRELRTRKSMQAERDALQDATQGDVWYFQDDGEDHPESLTCNVMMSAENFKYLRRLAGVVSGIEALAKNADAVVKSRGTFWWISTNDDDIGPERSLEEAVREALLASSEAIANAVKGTDH